MGCKTIQALWNRIDGLDVTPTEALVLTALAHFASDDFGYCHPRLRQVAQKCRLSRTATVSSLGSLKRKGFVQWAARPQHPNEYALPFGTAGGVVHARILKALADPEAKGGNA